MEKSFWLLKSGISDPWPDLTTRSVNLAEHIVDDSNAERKEEIPD